MKMRVTTQLKDIVSFSKGEQIKGSDLLEEGLYDYLNGGITPSGKWNRYNTPENTVTVSEGGNSCGYVNYMDRPFWCGAHCYYLFNAKLDNKYLYYALKSQQNRLMKIRSGACMPNIKKSDLGAFKLTYETNELEQKEIVKRLDKVKLVIDLRKAELQQLDELVKSRFVEMFGDVSTGVYNYETRKLGDVAFVGSSHRVFTTEFVDKGIPFYRGTEICELANGIKPSDPYYISENHYNRLASDESKPKIGDLLMPSICNKGQVWMVDTDEPFYYKDGRVLCISADRSIYNTKYLQYFMREKTQVEYPKLGSGSTFAEFKIFLLKDIDVLTPPMEVQNQFATFVEQVDKSKFCVTNHLKKIQLIKGELL